jgi:hypothetical protein
VSELARFLVEGKGLDSVQGFQPDFHQSLAAMFAAAPPEIQAQMRIGSGYRSNERQAELFEGALKKYGSEAAARKWVAPPGKSNHNHGQAADLKYLSPAATEWAHQNAKKFGLNFPLAHENWHIEPIGARGHQHSPNPAPAGPTVQTASASFQPGVSPTNGPVAGATPAPMPGFGETIANAFMQGGVPMFQQPDPRVQQAEKDAERQRKIALFDSVAQMYA